MLSKLKFPGGAPTRPGAPRRLYALLSFVRLLGLAHLLGPTRLLGPIDHAIYVCIEVYPGTHFLSINIREALQGVRKPSRTHRP
jgi:hypothetical protein